MKKLTTALSEVGMSLGEYDNLVSQYAKCALTLFWSYNKAHWVVEQIGGNYTYTHLKTLNIDHLRQVDVVRQEFDLRAGVVNGHTPAGAGG